MKGLFLALLLSVTSLAQADTSLPPWYYPTFLLGKPAQTSKSKTYPDTITLYGEVNKESAKDIINSIHEKQNKTKKPLFLVIDSRGGEVYAGLQIIDAIKMSERPVVTVIVGSADSMAAWIFEYGSVRLMNEHATLMFHYISGGFMGPIPNSASELNYWLGIMADLNAQTAKRSGMKLEELEAYEARELWLTAPDAIKHHLADTFNTRFVDYPANDKE